MKNESKKRPFTSIITLQDKATRHSSFQEEMI